MHLMELCVEVAAIFFMDHNAQLAKVLNNKDWCANCCIWPILT